MKSSVLLGFSLILVSAVASGVFGVALRRRRVFSVELMWLIIFLTGYLLLPHAIVMLALPGWDAALGKVGFVGLAPGILFGLGWGVASLFFAHGIAMLGVSLGYAIIMGLIIAVGSSLPLLRHWAAVADATRVAAVAGIALCLVGVVLCGRAGMLRERAGSQTQARRFGLGLALCVLSGVLSASANLGFEFSEPVARAFATQKHPALASIARWLPIYWGGSFVVLVFSVLRVSQRREWALLVAPGARRELGWSLFAAALLVLGLLPYGIGAHLMGPLGTSVGFAVNTAGSMLVANVMGLWLGEWRLSPTISRVWLWAGLITLVAAVIVLAGRAV